MAIITDEQLVAFSDGLCSEKEKKMIGEALVADQELRQRLDDIEFVDSQRLQGAFQSELELAPLSQLERILEQSDKVPGKSRFGKLSLAACLAGAVLVGAVGGSFLSMKGNNSQHISNWRESVAVYQMLYTKETLARVSLSASQRDAMRARLGKLSGLKIKIYDLEPFGLTFKRGQILEFKGKPLVQLAYLTNAGKPVAICFINQKQNDLPATSETRHGLNVVHWVKNSVPTMIVGDVPGKTLERISKEIVDG